MQAVAIHFEGGYGVDLYADESVDRFIFDFSKYEDEVPSLEDLTEIRERIDLIDLPEARKALEHWYTENKEWADDLQRENELDKFVLIDEINAAKKLLEDNGYEVTS